MSAFDKLAGLGESYTRRPLKTLGEAGGGKKASSAATTDYGPTPPEFKHGSPNTAFRAKPECDYGSDATMSGKVTAAALRTKKPYQQNAG